MNIHEYQAKALLKEFGVAGLRAAVAVFTADEAAGRGAASLAGPVWVVKAQIHAGGRGKGKFKEAAAGDKGGVRLAKSVEEVEATPARCWATTLVTDPDRPGRQEGQPPLHRGRLRHRAASSTSRCWSTARPARVAFIASTEGGMDIEEVAHDTPEKIVTVSIDPATGVMPHHGRAHRPGARASSGDLAKQAREAHRPSSTRPSSRRT